MAPAALLVDLPPRPSSAAEARRFVADALASTSNECRETAILLTSELVTNALLYAPGRIVLQVSADDHRYRIAVHDPLNTPVWPRSVDIESTRGRGLALVELLSSSWGVDLLDDEGKSIWFELPRA